MAVLIKFLDSNQLQRFPKRPQRRRVTVDVHPQITMEGFCGIFFCETSSENGATKEGRR